jgi:TrmH family RNA methyltransferase
VVAEDRARRDGRTLRAEHRGGRRPRGLPRAYRGTSICLAGDARHSIYEVDLRGPAAILVGNEGAGISRALRKAASVAARIPMPGRMESLNAGVRGSLCLFERRKA